MLTILAPPLLTALHCRQQSRAVDPCSRIAEDLHHVDAGLPWRHTDDAKAVVRGDDRSGHMRAVPVAVAIPSNLNGGWISAGFTRHGDARKILVRRENSGDLTERAVEPRRVVERLDIIEDGKLCVAAAGGNRFIEPRVGLEGAPKRFHRVVVAAFCWPAERLGSYCVRCRPRPRP